MTFKRCITCVMPNTRPDTPFVDGECQACRNHKARQAASWSRHSHSLIQLLDRHHYRCVVPSSGGKDSHAQVHALQELGADVLCVTATTCHPTEIGKANITNLARYADTIEITPNTAVRAKLNRAGLEMVGDISWPEHAAIFSIPPRIASQVGRQLVVYGENPQALYGGPQGTEKAQQMTSRWTSEFGGYLGLRLNDIKDHANLTDKQVEIYRPLPNMEGQVTAIFLGQYLGWDSMENARVATKMGMRAVVVTPANWWLAENQDNAQTGLHDHMMYRKYGYGRGCTQISVDVREGRISRPSALEWVREYDGRFPEKYAGVTIGEVLERIDISEDYLWQILDNFTNYDLFSGTEEHGRPILKDGWA
jgi:N-acetyl sugar amidotransferase